ncbi:MAG: hypothetical protein ACE5PT_08035 [Gemmatimonadales bacterium]
MTRDACRRLVLHCVRPISTLATLSLVGALLGGKQFTALAQTATNTPLLLQLPATLRSAGLSGAATALVGDAGSVFSNPAGLATIRHIALEGSYRAMPTERAFTGGGALGWRLGQFDVGFGARLFEFGDTPDAYLGPQVTAGQRAREVEGVGSLVYRFGMIALGASAKYVRRTVAGSRERALGMDAGLAIAVFDIMALAFSWQNVRGNWYESSSLRLPRLARLGFTMNYLDPQGTIRLRSILEVQWPEGKGARLALGGESGVVLAGVGLVARAGIASRPPMGDYSKATYGASLILPRFDVDYAYREADLLGRPAHLIGLRVRL